MTSDQKSRIEVGAEIEVFDCAACGSDHSDDSCRRPGNSLEGRVHISAKSPLQFTSLEVLFQGLQSTRVLVYRSEDNELVSYPSNSRVHSIATMRATDIFLDSNCRGPLHSIKQHEGEDGWKRYTFPFSFIVPSGYEYPNHEKPPLCQILPPSLVMTSNSRHFDASQDPALSITYTIRALVHYHIENDADTAAPGKVEATKEITYRPYSEVQPPTHTESFPGEFILSATTSIWKHALGGRLGSVVLSASEPLPLIYSAPTFAASTECTLSLIVYPISLSAHRLRNLSLGVKPAILARTFYSTEPISCMPKQTDLTQGLLRLHDKVIKLEEQQFSQLEWEYCHPSVINDNSLQCEALIRNDGRQSISNSSTTSSTSGGLSLQQSDSFDTPAEGEDALWRAMVRIAIKPPETLLPAFCSTLIARSYSLLFRVRLMGAYAKKIDLEIPLQAVYLRPSQTNAPTAPQQEFGPCVGPDALLAQQDILPAYRNKR